MGQMHPQLYSKLGNHIVAIDNLSRFDPQALSNIVWSYATAGESHPKLFSKFGDHIVAMKDLNRFDPQDFSNSHGHMQLQAILIHNYNRLANHIVAMKDLSEFWPQALSNSILIRYCMQDTSTPFPKVGKCDNRRRSVPIVNDCTIKTGATVTR
jgi:hypothetical protein